tara:strand:- start:5470 stop:7110 length:1641 start_codon:yes stop_codon:yes gene_type:complete
MIIFVSDAYKEDYIGGAELTTEAIIEDSLLPVIKYRSHEVTLNLMNQYKDSCWVFGNFFSVKEELLVYAAKNLNYYVIEYDYKYCKYRSIPKHIELEGSCSCEKTRHGKIIAIFMSNARKVFWMSSEQRQVYFDKFGFLSKSKNIVLSSVFDVPTMNYFKNLKIPEKNNKWLILQSSSWIKGTQDSIKYAKKNNLDYELVSGLSYDKMLNKLAESKGLIFRPLAGDTCPRIVIEAFLSGCELILNDNVQHKNESWFKDRKTALKYLDKRTKTFWSIVSNSQVDGDTPQLNKKDSKKQHYKIIVPFYNVESWISKCIRSLKFQDHEDFQCILMDDMSDDNTREIIEREVGGDNRFILVKNTSKKYALENVVEAINKANPENEDVIIILDGDDWLSSTNVLSRLNEVYEQEDCLLTYGTYIQYPSGKIGIEPSRYPEEVIKNNMFREDKWRASHLKSFKYILWKNFDTQDLKDTNDDFYKTAYDQAFMLPLLELSSERSVYLDDILYTYNRSNPLNVDKIKTKEQHNTMLTIRKKKKYNRLPDAHIIR